MTLLIASGLLLASCGAEETSSGAAPQEDATDTSVETPEDTTDTNICVLGSPCDDGDPCTHDDTCDENGECAGTAYECESEYECFDSTCDGAGNCDETLFAGNCWIEGKCYKDGQTSGPGDYCFVCSSGVTKSDFTVNIGNGCNDGDSCTQEDSCLENGDCEGVPRTCDDTNDCTYDSCDPSPDSTTGYPFTCVNEAVNVPCDDEDACTLGDFCSEGTCEAEQTIICEDDGKACTVEVCDAEAGCGEEALNCDDGNACTNDACENEEGGCVYTNLADGEDCDDKDVCSQSDSCQDGICVGVDPMECPEGDACSESICDPKLGCTMVFTSNECDDGFDCTINDICSASICAGDKATCSSCSDHEFQDYASRVNTFAIPEGGNPGSGLDLDNNPETCSPAENCSEGVDNAMSSLGTLINPSLQTALNDGEMNYLVEYVGLEDFNQPFTMRVYIGATDYDPTCVDDICEYEATWDNFTPDCKLRMEFTNTILKEDGSFEAGGPGSLFVVKGKISGSDITFVIFNSQVVGKVEYTVDDSGKIVVDKIINGLVGGAVPKTLLKETLEETNIIPTLKNLLYNYLDNKIPEDLDLDGNGSPDASSVSVRFTGEKAKIIGIY